MVLISVIAVIALIQSLPVIGPLLGVVVQVALPKRSLTPRSRGLVGSVIASVLILAFWLSPAFVGRGSLDQAAPLLVQSWICSIFVFWNFWAAAIALILGSAIDVGQHVLTGAEPSETNLIPEIVVGTTIGILALYRAYSLRVPAWRAIKRVAAVAGLLIVVGVAQLAWGLWAPTSFKRALAREEAVNPLVARAATRGVLETDWVGHMPAPTPMDASAPLATPPGNVMRAPSYDDAVGLARLEAALDQAAERGEPLVLAARHGTIVATGKVFEHARDPETGRSTWACTDMAQCCVSSGGGLTIARGVVRLPKFAPDACGSIVFDTQRVFVCRDGHEPAIRTADCKDRGGVDRRATESFRARASNRDLVGRM